MEQLEKQSKADLPGSVPQITPRPDVGSTALSTDGPPALGAGPGSPPTPRTSPETRCICLPSASQTEPVRALRACSRPPLTSELGPRTALSDGWILHPSCKGSWELSPDLCGAVRTRSVGFPQRRRLVGRRGVAADGTAVRSREPWHRNERRSK